MSFDNKTGDPVFDDTLKQALAVQLEQSPFLNVLPDERVNATLRLMGRPAGDRLTEDVARDLCQRAASKAMLAGSIDNLGNQYVIGLKALNCASGDTLAREQVQVTGKQEVLKAVSTAARNLRGRLGEAVATIHKFDTPIEQATTSSLEALKAYSLGLKAYNVNGVTAARPLFERAVELDPQFAIAYAYLGTLYRNLDEPMLAAENLRKAFHLREKVSERERLYIEARYYRYATGEFERWAQVCELWKQIYPRDRVPYNDLAHVYSAFGQYDKSVEEAREALRLAPNSVFNYANLANYYAAINRWDDAEAVLKQAEEHKLGGRDLLETRYRVAFLKGDDAEMQLCATEAAGNPRLEDLILTQQADTETYHGRLASARDLRHRAAEVARYNDAPEAAATWIAEAALQEALVGLIPQARADIAQAMRLGVSRNARVFVAISMAMVGDAITSEKLADELDKTFPLESRMQRYWIPTVRALVPLQRNHPANAIEALQATSLYELAPFGPGVNGSLFPVYVRGQAYLMLRNGGAAAAEFQKIIDHRGIVANFPLGALAHVGLARAYALQGDIAKARAAYHDFLTLWKDADPNIPIFQQAKIEFGKLK